MDVGRILEPIMNDYAALSSSTLTEKNEVILWKKKILSVLLNPEEISPSASSVYASAVI